MQIGQFGQFGGAWAWIVETAIYTTRERSHDSSDCTHIQLTLLSICSADTHYDSNSLIIINHTTEPESASPLRNWFTDEKLHSINTICVGWPLWTVTEYGTIWGIIFVPVQS